MVEYSPTRRDDTVDDYHGTSVADPYRWLESLDSFETLDRVDVQNEITFAHLDSIPGRNEVITGDSDDRVVPLHSYKFIAALQDVAGDSGPALLRVDRRAGHDPGQPIPKLIDQAADIYAFFLCHLR